MKRTLSVWVAGVALIMAACGPGGADGTGDVAGKAAVSAGTVDASLAGEWRVLSQAIYFDNGLTSKDAKLVPITTLLEVSADGSWKFGSSGGAWSVATIGDSDWTGWQIASYGPTRKIQVSGWSDGTNGGPIEESTGPVDYFWMIYPYTSDANGPGTVWMKFGRN